MAAAALVGAATGAVPDRGLPGHVLGLALFPRLKLLYVPLGFSFHLLILVALNAKFFEWMGTYAIFVPWALVATFLLGRLGARGQVPLATKG